MISSSLSFRLALTGLATALLLTACGPHDEPATASSGSPLAAQLRGLTQPIEAMRAKLRETLRESLGSQRPDLAALQARITSLNEENQRLKARITSKVDDVTKQMQQFRTDASAQVGQGKVDPATMTSMAGQAQQFERETSTVTAQLSALQHEMEELSNEITRWSNTVSAARQLRGDDEAGKLARQLIQQHLDMLEKKAGH